jgi:outer membrane protein assembly factor BamB
MIWKHTRDFVDAPVIAGNTVYDVNANGRIFGINIKTGAITFRSTTSHPTTHDPNGVPSDPAVADNTLVVPEGQHLVGIRGTRSGGLTPAG